MEVCPGSPFPKSTVGEPKCPRQVTEVIGAWGKERFPTRPDRTRQGRRRGYVGVSLANLVDCVNLRREYFVESTGELSPDEVKHKLGANFSNS